MSKDFSNLIKQTGVKLEKTALDKFGASTLSNKIGAAFNSNSKGKLLQDAISKLSADNAPIRQGWDSTRYASTIASGRGGFDPKIKFLFRVTFEFDEDVRNVAMAMYGEKIADIVSRNLTYTIKNIDMPKYKFMYDEFNYYNFRTKTLKKIEHEPVSFVMYDDIGNNSLDFINAYLRLLSPIHRHKWTQRSPLENSGIQPDFNDLETPTSAQRSVLGAQGNAKNVLFSIKIDQYYVDRSNPNLDNPRDAVKMNTYIFTNPRLDSFDVDGNDYEEGGSPHMISCTFDFDALHIETGLAGEGTDGSGINEAYDILSGSPSTPKHSRTTKNSDGGGGRAISQFTQAIATQTRSLLNINNIANRATNAGGAAGLGVNASSILNVLQNRSPPGNVISAGISRAASSIISDQAIGGAVTGQIRSRINGLGG